MTAITVPTESKKLTDEVHALIFLYNQDQGSCGMTTTSKAEVQYHKFMYETDY